MTTYSRRQFLNQIGAVAGLFLAGKSAFSFPFLPSDNSDFEILVVGDSFIWGQGLREEDKFYSLVKNWLQKEVVINGRNVNLKVKAHSGSRIYIHEDELAEMTECGEDAEKFHHPEIDISFPSITFQIDTARKEYENPDSVKLVMLSGGITDLVVANTVNPFLREGKMRDLIHKYSHAAMQNLLEHISNTFPEAYIVVVGYFPIVSTKSDVNKITKYLMKIVKFPHPFQFLLTNIFSKQFMKIIRKAVASRSRIWVAESNKEMRDAVKDANEKCQRTQILFVESPITEENCFATKNSMLWGTDDDNKPEDDLYKLRKTVCPAELKEIKYKPYGFFSVRLCELASIAHPNKLGSIAYAEAIKARLKPIFQNQNS